MTDAEMKERTIVAQDMLDGMRNQRDAHANECVHLAAQVKSLQRRVQELESALAAQAAPKAVNGHAETQTAA